jgi:hypothetical protein
MRTAGTKKENEKITIWGAYNLYSLYNIINIVKAINYEIR